MNSEMSKWKKWNMFMPVVHTKPKIYQCKTSNSPKLYDVIQKSQLSILNHFLSETLFKNRVYDIFLILSTIKNVSFEWIALI